MKVTKANWLLTVLSGTGAGLYPVVSAAMGLGDIQVDSRLNQTLRARIEIIGVSDEEWRLVHARLALQALSSEDAAYPELLGAVTLSAIEDADHRHFIQVKSRAVFTEPLFDLPIEVSAESTHVIRSYSVLLDPEETSGAPRIVADSNITRDPARAPSVSAAAQPVKADSAAVAGKAKKVTGQRAARRSSGRASKHKRSHRHAPSTASASAAHAPAKNSPSVGSQDQRVRSAPTGQVAGSAAEGASARAKGPAQEQLERQLTLLQQTLTQMQATIAVQDAEIAKLTRQVADSDAPARAAVAGSSAQEPAAHATAKPASAARSQSVEPPDSDADTSNDDTGSSSFWLRPKFFYWLAAGLGVTAVLVAASLWFARRRKAGDTRVVVVEDRYAQTQKDVSQSTFKVEQPSSYQVEEHSEAPRAARPVEAPAAQQQDDDQDGMESWRTQTALLEQDIFSATETLPLVLDEHNRVEPTPDETQKTQQLQSPRVEAPRGRAVSSVAADDEKTLELQQSLESLELQQTLESLELQQTLKMRPLETQPGEVGKANRDVVQTLESTLDIEPERVDVQLKLLEIYHHEALGNRDNFHSMLSRLKVEQGALSPAQVAHLEMLRRTLEDGKEADADSNFEAEAAM
jgi:hypothetical protein